MATFEFDSTYSALTGEHVGGLYIPTLENGSGGYDVLIDGAPDHLTAEWHALTGYTQQSGYRGAVMHPSEAATDEQIREWVRDAGGDVFALCVVHDGYDGEFAGWAVIYQTAEDAA